MAVRFLQGNTIEQVEAVCQAEDVLAMQREAAQVTVKESVLGYMEDIIHGSKSQSPAGAGPCLPGGGIFEET